MQQPQTQRTFAYHSDRLIQSFAFCHRTSGYRLVGTRHPGQGGCYRRQERHRCRISELQVSLSRLL